MSSPQDAQTPAKVHPQTREREREKEMEEDRREDGGRGWGQGVVGGGVVLRTAREGCCNEPNIVTLRVEKESHCTISNCWRGVGGGTGLRHPTPRTPWPPVQGCANTSVRRQSVPQIPLHTPRLANKPRCRRLPTLTTSRRRNT